MEVLFHETISSSTIILFAALGGLFTSIAGKLNIGLEGLMLISAFLTPFFSQLFGSLFLGLTLSIIVCAALGAFTYLLHSRFKANIFVVGLAMNLFAAGLTTFLSSALLNSKGTVYFTLPSKIRPFDLPLLSDIPLVGNLFSHQNAFDYLSFVLVILIFLVLEKTFFGLRLKTVGFNHRTAESAGIPVKAYSYSAFILSGVFCALSGAALALPLESFVGNMTNGRGWIALVAVILGKNNPIGVLAASLIFGFSSTLANLLQINTAIPPKLLMTIPFLITLLALIVYSARMKK
jgi:simple sugar transport system permease protein